MPRVDVIVYFQILMNNEKENFVNDCTFVVMTEYDKSMQNILTPHIGKYHADCHLWQRIHI